MKVDLGCGENKKEGFVGIDKYAFKGVDYVIDLDKQKLPFKDNSVDFMYSFHCLEHLSNFDEVMNEIFRVLKKGGVFEFFVPYFSYPLVNSPYHKIYFNFDSFSHFGIKSETFTLQHCFDVLERKLIFRKDLGIGKVFGLVFNTFPLLYEKTFFCYLIPARRMYFRFRK